MSELTRCNYCNLQRIRKRAKAAGKKVTVLTATDWELGGKSVYVHPKDVKVTALLGGEKGEREKYFVSWFMALGTRCEC